MHVFIKQTCKPISMPFTFLLLQLGQRLMTKQAPEALHSSTAPQGLGLSIPEVCIREEQRAMDLALQP